MNYTTSIAFPNMINVAGNMVSVKSGKDSITNRVRLLMLTDPTELYNSPDFGAGLKRYLWQYNTVNTSAMIKDRITQQLRKYEPCVIADKTSFADGLIFSEGQENALYNELNMTVGLHTIYEDELSIALNNE